MLIQDDFPQMQVQISKEGWMGCFVQEPCEALFTLASCLRPCICSEVLGKTRLTLQVWSPLPALPEDCCFQAPLSRWKGQLSFRVCGFPFVLGL